MALSSLVKNIAINVGKFKNAGQKADFNKQKKQTFNDVLGVTDPSVIERKQTPSRKLAEIAGPAKEQPNVTAMLNKPAPEVDEQISVPEFLKPSLNTALKESFSGQQFDREDPEQQQQFEKISSLISATKPKERFAQIPGGEQPQKAPEGAVRAPERGVVKPGVEREELPSGQPPTLPGVTEGLRLDSEELFQGQNAASQAVGDFIKSAPEEIKEKGFLEFAGESGVTLGKNIVSFGAQIPKTILTTFKAQNQNNPIAALNNAIFDAVGLEGVADVDRASREGLNQTLSPMIDSLTEVQTDIAESIQDPFQQKLFMLGNGVTSMAAALGIAALTKNPGAAAAVLSSLESSDTYNDAIEAGKHPTQALALATVSGVGTYYLEKASLDVILGDMLKTAPTLVRALFKGGVEGFTEAGQTGFQSSVNKIGFDETIDVFQGLWDSLWVGSLVGGGSSLVVDSINSKETQGPRDDASSKLQEKGLSPEEADQAAGNMADMVMTQQEKIANGVNTSFKEGRTVGLRGLQPEGRPGIEKAAPLPTPTEPTAPVTEPTAPITEQKFPVPTTLETPSVKDFEKFQQENPEITFENTDDMKLIRERGVDGKVIGIENRAGEQKMFDEPIEGPKLTGQQKKVAAIGANVANRAVNTSVDITSSTASLMAALKKAKPIRAAQEQVFRKERGGKLKGVLEERAKLGGEAGFAAEKARLKGELTKVEFESLRDEVSQDDIDNLFNAVKTSENISEWDKLAAQKGLAKLFGAEGGVVPTRGEIKMLEKVFPAEVIDTLVEKQPLLSRLGELGTAALNVPRTIMTSFDLSAPLRQGAFMLGRPKQFIPAFGSMLKQFVSEDAYKASQQEIQDRDTFPEMKEAGLAITDIDAGLTEQEEAYMGINLAEQIPILGRGIRASGRAYTGFLNKLRADVFDDILSKTKDTDIKVTDKFLSSLGKFVNSATGRGALGKPLGVNLEDSAELLNAVFFSPRLMASRINLLNPNFYHKLDPTVRKEALKTLISTTSIMSTLMGLASLIPGAEVGDDARSANFGKIMVGNTKIDLLGGFQQYIKLGAQLYSGEIVSSTSGKTITLGEGFRPMTRGDIISRFFSNKENPIASFATGLVTGQDAIGNDFDPTEQVISRFIPMVVSDMYDIYKEGDMSKLGLAPLAVFGGGLQTYGQQELVFGENKMGESGAQVRPLPGLAEDITNKIFGEGPIGTTTAVSAQKFYQQLKELPKETMDEVFDKIWDEDQDLADKILKAKKDDEAGITAHDLTLKEKGVSNGDRATAVWKELEKLDSDERDALTDEYWDKKIITNDVWTQIVSLKTEAESEG